MGRWDTVGALLEAAAVVFLIAMVAGQLLGQPVLLGYVETGSMQPTLNPGDGFVAIPTALAGPVERGDVVTFRAKEVQGGGLTTHRVVEVTDRGYITRGDNNPFTDQDGDEPPVRSTQIVAVAWRPGGEVLVIPEVGTVVTGTHDALRTVQQGIARVTGVDSLARPLGLTFLFLAITLFAYGIDRLFASDNVRQRRDNRRKVGTNARLAIGVFTAMIVLAATLAMVVPSGPQEFGVVSAEIDAPGPGVIEQGTNESVRYAVGNGGFVPVVTYLEPTTEGISVQPGTTTVPPRSSVNATLTLSAPPETGYYRRYIVRHRYLLVLPQSTIRGLYHAHPWLPIVVIDLLLGVPLYVLGVAFAGTGRLRSRSRDHQFGAVTRLHRTLRRLY